MRYLNLGTVDARVSQAVYHALAQQMRPDHESTLITVSPDRPYVCVGYHQLASREIDRQFCEERQIPIARRYVGGGAVYLDRDQVFWHLLLPRPIGTVEQLYRHVLQAPIVTYRQMGIPADFRPVNDIVVGPRKIGGTGASTIGTTTVIVGSLMFDFDVEIMARVLNVPSEKFRDKVISSLRDYMTTIPRELTSPPRRDQVVAALVTNFAGILDESIHLDRLSHSEEMVVQEYARRLFDPDFVFRGESGLESPGVKIRDSVYVREGMFKAPGGLLRLLYRVNEGIFDDVHLSGDFFMQPWDSPALAAFENHLKGQDAREDNVLQESQRLLQQVSIPGVSAANIVECFRRAEL